MFVLLTHRILYNFCDHVHFYIVSNNHSSVAAAQPIKHNVSWFLKYVGIAENFFIEIAENTSVNCSTFWKCHTKIWTHFTYRIRWKRVSKVNSRYVCVLKMTLTQPLQFKVIIEFCQQLRKSPLKTSNILI